ncbi:MAG: homoserine kinase [Actinomycetota bacterium]|nr:homoserine kinase [Actinomycetota bacterium]
MRPPAPRGSPDVAVLRPWPVRVRVPATSANLGPGYDSLGLALRRHDEITVVAGDRLRVEVLGEGADTLPRDETHLVVSSMRRAFAAWGVDGGGLHLRCVNDLPHGRGLGSSAAAIVAGMVAARALLSDRSGIDDEELLDLAAGVEGHPDNVAACLFGGLTVAWREEARVRCTRLEPHPDVRPVLFVPDAVMSTGQARDLLPARVPHADAAFTAARAALLVVALTQRPELLLSATEDRLHQPYRAASMPAAADLVRRLRAARVPAVVSGAGPAVLAFPGRQDVSGLAGPGWDVRRVGVDRRGAQVLREEGPEEAAE